MLAAGPLALAAAGRLKEPTSVRRTSPIGQRLVAVLGVEPGTLDPATSVELIEERVIYALFEGLTTLHPRTGEAMAGLATHYEVTPDSLRYTFYLRGHPEPRGIRLANRDDLPWSIRAASQPLLTPCRRGGAMACRSRLKIFVYSWRRTIDPATGCPVAYLMHCIVNAEEINSGSPAGEAGSPAIDDSTVEVDLRAPAPFFLELIASKYFCPVPRHVIETAGKAWTEPGRMVTSGAFTLRERRRREGCSEPKSSLLRSRRRVAEGTGVPTDHGCVGERESVSNRR